MGPTESFYIAKPLGPFYHPPATKIVWLISSVGRAED
jgi:hypothetical protein